MHVFVPSIFNVSSKEGGSNHHVNVFGCIWNVSPILSLKTLYKAICYIIQSDFYVIYYIKRQKKATKIPQNDFL